MSKITTLKEAEQALAKYYRSTSGSSRQAGYGLDTMRALMAFLGDPQNTLQVVHIAGTSGKTSTAYYTAALLKSAGFTVGLTVSPHVEALTDRVQMNGKPMHPKRFCADLEQFLALVEQSGLSPAYPLVLTAFALWEFARQKVDYAVVEVGVGGLLDSTNVVDRADKFCIITDIGFDHMHLLGNTLPEIADQKAGIIQLHNTVACYRQDDVILDQIKKRSQQKQADLHVIENDAPSPEAAELPLFQQRNFTLAKYAVSELLARDDKELTSDMVKKAATIEVPGRMEEYRYAGKNIIFDGAHNPQKIDALMQSVAQKYPDAKVAAVVAFIEKDNHDTLDRVEGCIKEMKPFVHSFIATQFGGEIDTPFASVSADIVAAVAKTEHIAHVETVSDPWQALQHALGGPESVVVVTGSFYLLNHTRTPLLG